MKKLGYLLSILCLSTVLVACGEEPVEEPKNIEKTALNYTYSDVCANYYRTSNAIPNKGEPNLLVIPVYFSDSGNFIDSSKKDIVRNDIEKAFFGTKEDIGYESVSSYYATLSSNKCILKGTVTNWVEVEPSYMTYSISEDETKSLVSSTVEDYFSKANIMRTVYDSDENGYLDGVVIIYAAPDYENFRNSASYSNFWAYTNWIDVKPNIESPVACNFMWASYDFMYSRDTALSKIGNPFGSGDTSFCSIDTHVFIHEIGHMFGLIDYYDYSYQFSPAGAFSMQDHNVGCHDPYSVMALGWCDPYMPTESCTITLNTFQSSRECIILSNSWNEINSPFDEYLVVELYSPDGLNEFDHLHSYQGTRATGPDEIGIRLWHVDARLLYGLYNDATKFTCDPTFKSSKIMHMMSNTYSGGSAKGYTTPLGGNYTKFNLLQLIRNEETETYQPHNSFDKYSLFKDGNKFSMNTFGKQFPNTAKLNTNKVLGWNFTVEIANNQAKINLTRTI